MQGGITAVVLQWFTVLECYYHGINFVKATVELPRSRPPSPLFTLRSKANTYPWTSV